MGPKRARYGARKTNRTGAPDHEMNESQDLLDMVSVLLCAICATLKYVGQIRRLRTHDDLFLLRTSKQAQFNEHNHWT